MRDANRGPEAQPGLCSAAVTRDGTGAGHGHIDVILLKGEPLHAAAVVWAGLAAEDHGSLEDLHRVEGGGLPARLGIDATFAAAPGEGQLAGEPVLVFIDAVEQREGKGGYTLPCLSPGNSGNRLLRSLLGTTGEGRPITKLLGESRARLLVGRYMCSLDQTNHWGNRGLVWPKTSQKDAVLLCLHPGAGDPQGDALTQEGQAITGLVWLTSGNGVNPVILRQP